MNMIVGMLMQKSKKEYSKKEFKQMRAEAEERFHELCEENKEDSKALKKHTMMCIFPAIATYDTLVEHGMEKGTAVDRISDVFTGFCGKGFKMFSLWLHMFGNYHRYPANFVKNSLRDFSPDAGFEYRMPDKPEPGVARFDIVKCPYYTMCRKYNCPELNRAFCDSDDAKYGNLHQKLSWQRTGTLGKGADCCDFRISDTSKNSYY